MSGVEYYREETHVQVLPACFLGPVRKQKICNSQHRMRLNSPGNAGSLRSTSSPERLHPWKWTYLTAPGACTATSSLVYMLKLLELLLLYSQMMWFYSMWFVCGTGTGSVPRTPGSHSDLMMAKLCPSVASDGLMWNQWAIIGMSVQLLSVWLENSCCAKCENEACKDRLQYRDKH